MPTVEIVSFTASDAFVADPSIIKDVVKNLLDWSDGAISAYYGLQTEDSRTGYLLILWESYEHHADFQEHPAYPGLITALKRAHTSPLDVQHVIFNRDVVPAFESPVLELAWVTPKEGANLQDTITPLHESLRAEPACHGVAMGESREKPGSWIVALGWDSVKAHYDAIGNGDNTASVNELIAISASFELKHTSLIKHTA